MRERLAARPNRTGFGVTAITSLLGEGTTVTSTGASSGLNDIGQEAFACVLELRSDPAFVIDGSTQLAKVIVTACNKPRDVKFVCQGAT